MNHSKHPNNEILRNYIDHISYNVNLPNPDEFTPVLPDGMTELIINLGDSFERRPGENAKIEKVKSSHFIGIKSKHHFLRTNNFTRTLRVRFKPGVLGLFIKCKQDELTDGIIDAEEIFPNDFRETERRIREMNDPEQMIREIEKYFLNRMNPGLKEMQIITTIKFLYNDPAQLKIEILKEKTGMDYKQLERSFRKFVGVQPKHFINMIKFNFAAKQMYEQPEKPLTQIALDSGYYDQSHFIKNFKQFSGQNPKNYFHNGSERILRNQIITNRLFRTP